MIVLAFDPGETTGWCYMNTATDEVECGSFERWREVPSLVVRYFPVQGSYPQARIVIERFMLYPWLAKRLKWDKLLTVEVIGVIKYLAESYGIEYVMQSARTGKLIELQNAPAGLDRHAHDAMRHALMYLKTKNALTDKLREYIR